MPAVSVPPPPSASDRIGSDGSTVAPKAKRQSKKRASGETDAAPRERRLGTPPSAAASPGYADRIDRRPARQDMQLEDDPRAVRPVMQNGRPGVGMRF